MDVKKLTLLLGLCTLLISCDTNDDNPIDDQFNKTNIDACEGQRVRGEYLVRWKNGDVSIETGGSEKEFIEEFIKPHTDEILFAEPNYRIKVSRGMSPSSRGFEGPVNWGVEKVQAEKAWDLGYKGQGIVIAIIDSGMDVDHAELKNTLAMNPEETLNKIDDDGNGLIDDIHGYDFVADSGEVMDYTGHGTHIAGTIAADHSSGEILGVAPDVKLLPLTFIDASDLGSVLLAIDAIRYSVIRGANIINASWGGPSCSKALREEIESLKHHNILFISASGNSGEDLDNFPEFPASYGLDNQIVVGASTYNNLTAGFSNHGNRVDLVAPGANIISTIPLAYDIPEPGEVADGLHPLNGTSMATPHVAAAAALLWSKKPDASYSEIKAALFSSVTAGPYPVRTRGLLNIAEAIQRISVSTPPPL